jgi:hypothetical protein
MRRAHGIRDRECVTLEVAQRQWATAHLLIQRSSFDELHDEIVVTLVFADVVQRHDTRMAQRRHDARFVEKAAAMLVGPRELGTKQLDRDRASEPRIGGLEHLAHAARRR